MLSLYKAADLAGALLDDGIAERHLTVTRQHRAIVAPNRKDGGRMEGRLHPSSVSWAGTAAVLVLVLLLEKK